MFNKLGKTECFSTANTKCFGERFYPSFPHKGNCEISAFFLLTSKLKL